MRFVWNSQSYVRNMARYSGPLQEQPKNSPETQWQILTDWMSALNLWHPLKDWPTRKHSELVLALSFIGFAV